MLVKQVSQIIFLCFLAVSTAHANVIPIEEVFEPTGPYPKELYVKVAVVAASPIGTAQIPATDQQAEDYKMRNRQYLESFIRQAVTAGAEMVITSEFGITGYPDIPELPSEEDNFRSREDIAPFIEPVQGKSFEFFSALAKELGVYIQYGLATGETKDAPYHNTAVVVGPTGKLEVFHHKIGLFELEHHYLEAGTVGGVFESPAGKVGLMICSDTYTEATLAQYRGKIDVISLSTSWARYNSGMNQFRYTARDVGAYLLAANHMYFPDSGVVYPTGETQSHIRQSSGIAYGYLPRKPVAVPPAPPAPPEEKPVTPPVTPAPPQQKPVDPPVSPVAP